MADFITGIGRKNQTEKNNRSTLTLTNKLGHIVTNMEAVFNSEQLPYTVKTIFDNVPNYL